MSIISSDVFCKKRKNINEYRTDTNHESIHLSPESRSFRGRPNPAKKSSSTMKATQGMTMRLARWVLSFASIFCIMTMVYQLKMQSRIVPSTETVARLSALERNTTLSEPSTPRTQQDSLSRVIGTNAKNSTKTSLASSLDAHSSQNIRSEDTLGMKSQRTIATSRCHESDASNYTTTYFKRHNKLSDFLEGPALQRNNLSAAVCEFQHIQYSTHFPHAMQQLYRCYSWWQANPNLPAILLWQKEKNRGKGSSFLKGFKTFLRDGMNVSIVGSHYEHAARAKLVDGFPESFALRGPEDARVLTKQILSYFGTKYVAAGCHNDTKACPRIAILNRRPKREILNVREIVEAVQSVLGSNCSVTVTHFEQASFLDQVRFFAETDLVLSPHGAQLTGIPFLPRCGSVLEFFPAGIFLPQYFGSLAATSGIQHGYIYLGTNLTAEMASTQQSIALRRQIRARPICPPINKIVSGIQQMLHTWKKCCAE